MSEPRGEQELIETITAGLPPEQATALVALVKKLTAEAVREALPNGGLRPMRSKGFTAEAAALTRLLAAKSGDTLEGALLKALTFYGIALDAVHAGDRVAILNPDDEIVRNIVGFETPDLAREALAR